MSVHLETAGDRAAAARRWMRALCHFARDRSGATAIEYGLICSLIFLAIVSGVTGVANNTLNMYNKIQNNV